MAIQTRVVPYQCGDTSMDAYVAYDDAMTAPRPAVAVAHAWSGRSDFEEGKARWLAELGYVGVALDVYGVGVRGTTIEENSTLMTRLVEDRPELQARLLSGIDAMAALPEVDSSRMAAIGYCFGGLSVLDIARTGRDLRGVVSFHGLFMPADNIANTPISAKVLCLHGYEDPMVPPEAVAALADELTKAGADWQIHAFGHTAHAFTNPQANDPENGMQFSPDAERRSRGIARDFLAEVLA